MAEPENRESETTRVATRLREQIIDGERPPGSRLVERELAAELGVSRVPVREGLRLLAAEGLITPRPRTWAIVREFTERDVRELEEVRTSLDTLAFTSAARRHDDAGLARLERVLVNGEAAAQAGDAVTAHRAAAAFHSTVVELADNTHLQELWGTIQSRVRWMLSQHDDLLVVTQEHRGLFEALASRNEELLERLVVEHAQTSRDQHRERQARRS
ncbi:GntR family transcriptional regulator [Nesterenkonia sp. PF2B19]|uniref:GntR family transcriptional regulator n=1 Tax=Nesterenkonia sp. K-15-9-6 TaxID=3093918 RepID=UPI000873117B